MSLDYNISTLLRYAVIEQIIFRLARDEILGGGLSKSAGLTTGTSWGADKSAGVGQFRIRSGTK